RELVVRLVLELLPVAAPGEAGDALLDMAGQIDVRLGLLFRLAGVVDAVDENADVPGDCEVVIRSAAACVGHDVAGLGPALREDRVLLRIGPCAGQNPDR